MVRAVDHIVARCRADLTKIQADLEIAESTRVEWDPSSERTSAYVFTEDVHR